MKSDKTESAVHMIAEALSQADFLLGMEESHVRSILRLTRQEIWEIQHIQDVIEEHSIDVSSLPVGEALNLARISRIHEEPEGLLRQNGAPDPE
jgi:protein-tyrosine-phosphatase